MPLRIVVAPSGFKESFDGDEAADCIGKGILRALPSAEIHMAPLVGGGEGFAKALAAASRRVGFSARLRTSTRETFSRSHACRGTRGSRRPIHEAGDAAHKVR